MFTEKTIKQAWSLYQASIKHSGLEPDFHKLIEESKEFEECYRIDVNEDDNLFYEIKFNAEKLIEEYTDRAIMQLRQLCYILKPKSYEEFELYIDNLSECMEHKTERTLKRFEEGFYK